MSTNTILATTPLVSTNYLLRATGTTIGNSLIWDNGTNVGIGNTNTSFTFDVTGNSRFTTGSKIATTSGQLLVGSNTSTIGTALEVVGDIYASNKIYGVNGTAANPSIRFFAGASGLYSTTGDDLGISTNGANRLYISSTGNVGIGTSSPTQKLEVYTGNYDGVKINATDVPSLFFYLQSGSQKNWGIASTNLAAGDFGIYQSNSNAGNPITAGTARLYITSGGGVCLGYTTDAGYQLRMSGYLYVGGNIVVAGDGSFGGLAGSGNRAVYSNARGQLTNSSSDKTLKTNVSQIAYGLDTVLNLKPISFNWIDTENMGTQTEIGFIAQEVKELIPEVIGINNNETLSLDYPKLTAVLVKAIQEQQAQIEELSNRLIKLESK